MVDRYGSGVPVQRLRQQPLAGLSSPLFNPSFRCVRKLVGASDGVLEFEFETELDGVWVNAIDLMRWNEASRVIEFKVMVRPLKAIELTQQRIGAMLQAE